LQIQGGSGRSCSDVLVAKERRSSEELCTLLVAEAKNVRLLSLLWWVSSFPVVQARRKRTPKLPNEQEREAGEGKRRKVGYEKEVGGESEL
jgi:hypothetical protein